MSEADEPSPNWCPECGEPREVCAAYGQCATVKPARIYLCEYRYCRGHDRPNEACIP